MKNWSCALWSFLASLVIIIVSLIVVILYIYYLMGRIWYYLIAITFVLVFALLYTIYHKNTKKFHFHHANIFLLLIILLGF